MCTGGDEEGIAVDEVGSSGVGYFCCRLSHLEGESCAMRLAGRGKVGEEKGSKAGSKEGAGRLTPATGGTEDLWLLGEESRLGISSAILVQVLDEGVLGMVEKREGRVEVVIISGGYQCMLPSDPKGIVLERRLVFNNG